MGFSLSLPLTPKPKSLQEFLTKMGFFTPSLMNHLCLNAFSRRPLLSTLLCSLHQSGRRGEVTSIATNICHLSTLKFQNLNVTNSLMISKQRRKTLHYV
nr:uncharacterized protein LOC111986722 isoform X2 [Quercus suber]